MDPAMQCGRVGDHLPRHSAHIVKRLQGAPANSLFRHDETIQGAILTSLALAVSSGE